MQLNDIHILHVDDNKDDLAIFKYHLTSLDKKIEVDWALSGEDAINILSKKEYDCLISDYEMAPGMNGLDLLIKVKEIKPNLPFIFLTGQGNERIAAEAFHLGANDYFTKNYTSMYFQRIINSINQGINGHRKQLEREQMQASLIESEERYRRLVEMNPKAIVVHYDGNVVYFNDAALNMLGKDIKADEFVGKSVLDLIHPDQRESARKRIREAMAGILKTEPVVYFAQIPGKSDTHVEVTSIPITYEGKPAVLSVLDDISDRLRAEEASRNLNSLLNAIRNVNQVINLENDFRKVITKTTAILANVRNYSGVFFAMIDEKMKLIEPVFAGREAPFLKKWTVDLDGRGDAPRCVKKALKSGELQEIERGSSLCKKCKFSKFQGDSAHVLVPFRIKGKPAGLFYITVKKEHKIDQEEINLLKDIAGDLEFCYEKLEAEKSLKLSEEKYRILFDFSPDGMTISSIDDGRIKDVNEEFYRKTGYTRNEVIGKTTIELGIWMSVDDRKRFIKELQAKGFVKDASFSLQGKNGRKFKVLLSAHPIEFHGEIRLLTIARDMTELDNIFQNLSFSEERYRSILDNAHDAIIVAKADGGIIEANQVASDLLGFTNRDFLSMKFQGIQTPEGNKKTSEILTETKLNEKTRFETTLLTRTGESREVEIRSVLFNYKDESLFQAFIHDISTEKKAERRRTRLHKFLWALADANYKLLASNDPRGEIGTVLETLGKASEAGRCYWFESHSSEENLSLKLQAEWADAGLKKRIENPRCSEIKFDAHKFDWHRLFENGRIIQGSIEKVPVEIRPLLECSEVKSLVIIPIIYDKDFKGILGLDECRIEREWSEEEITLLKAAADSFGSALKQEKIKREFSETNLIMSEFMNSTSDCFEIRDPAGRFVVVNHAAADIYETTPNKMIGKTDYDFLSRRTAEIFEKEFRKVVTGKKSREFLFFNSDLSEPHIYHTLLFPLVDPIKGGILVGSIKRDVTERQKNEEKIKKINLELDEFVHTVCHDLKVPLQSMIGYLDILKILEGNEREEVRLKALSQGEMMQDFMTQLLKLSSVGRSIGSILPFNSTFIVKDVFEVFKMNYPNALLQIIGDLPVITGDINRVREVFQNIIANALENADPQKSRPIVTISCSNDNKQYVFSIKDNGKGMDAKALKKLFTLGYTTSRDNTHRFGIGLNIAKRIIEAHGGEIWAESQLGIGSSFYFSIPYKK
jgi:PAS domain S-box-containing protein